MFAFAMEQRHMTLDVESCYHTYLRVTNDIFTSPAK